MDSAKQYSKRKCNAQEQLKTKWRAAYDRYKKAFGNRADTVVAMHHQWLYGRSVLLGAINILSMYKERDKYSSAFPWTKKGQAGQYYSSPEETMWEVPYMISTIMGTFNKPEFASSRIGFERFNILNRDEPGMMHDCTAGDNNDGITILDLTGKVPKYCFMNIYGVEGYYSLPLMCPLTAREYVESYYPVEEKELQSAENYTPEELEKKKNELKAAFEANKKENEKYIEQFKGAKLLTVEELKKMFPKIADKFAERPLEGDLLIPVKK